MTTILVHCKDIEEPFWRHREAAEAVAGGCECSRCTPAAVYCVSDTQHRKRFHSSVRDPPGKGISCLNQIIGSMLEGCFFIVEETQLLWLLQAWGGLRQNALPRLGLGPWLFEIGSKAGKQTGLLGWVGGVGKGHADLRWH